MWNEFKKFAMKGNVIDLAVGVVIGSAFGKIVTSLVNDIITPIIGFLTGGIDFTDRVLSYGTVHLKYGSFIQSIIDFIIITFSIFLFVKLINKFKYKEVVVEEQKKIDAKEELLTEIRDLLKKQQVRDR